MNRGMGEALRGGRAAPLQLILDGADSNTAGIVLNYAMNIAARYNEQLRVEQIARQRGTSAACWRGIFRRPGERCDSWCTARLSPRISGIFPLCTPIWRAPRRCARRWRAPAASSRWAASSARPSSSAGPASWCAAAAWAACAGSRSGCRSTPRSRTTRNSPCRRTSTTTAGSGPRPGRHTPRSASIRRTASTIAPAGCASRTIAWA